MLQPHEDVVGVERGPWLSLSDEAWPAREFLLDVAGHLWNAVTVGHPAPVVGRMAERMWHPEPDDFVVEISGLSGRQDREHRTKASGFLICHRDEWATTDESWSAYVAAEAAHGVERSSKRLTDHAWYVQYGPRPADICRWTNCTLYMIPTGADHFWR